jgi:pimeloyl-ACP methyl ester carboxylesterase
MNALRIERPTLAGYDWGGRAACIVAALWPERVAGLVSGSGYNIQDIATSGEPAPAEQEHRLWYQYYFHTERGRAGLTKNRRDVCRLLWRLWSPEWQFDDTTFERSASSFDNPDFVDVVIQSYRHRYRYTPGDPALAPIEAKLTQRPKITVPTKVLHGGHDGVGPAEHSEKHQRFFTGPYQRRILPRIGHNLPQEAPIDFATAVLDLAREHRP